MGKDAPHTLASLGVPAAPRHAFLCVGPDCCSESDGSSSWSTLKEELKRAGSPVLRSKAACLRLCQQGPWMVVYPEAVWYAEVTPEKCRRIVQEHLVGGTPVEDYIIGRGLQGCKAHP